ncbi:MAG: CoA transferase [Halioglobus sp.]
MTTSQVEETLHSQLLAGLRVIDIAGEPLAMTGRLLADMGAEVIKLEPPGGDPLRCAPPLSPEDVSLRFLAWNAGKTCLRYDKHSQPISELLRHAEVVIETPGFAGALTLARSAAPEAVWLQATPFGPEGPRAHWQASDIGLMAACGNMHCTGDADRPPLRCTEPAAYAHCAAEAAFAILTALAAGGAQTIDLSMQDALLIANMGGAAQFPKTGRSGQRQGAMLGRTREIWPCRDGYVSFGLRGGPARAGNFAILLAALRDDGLDTAAWRNQDWNTFNPQQLDAQELRDIETPLLDYFARHNLHELYELAVRTNLMLAPAQSAAAILGNEQLRSRGMFAQTGNIDSFPARFFIAQNADHPAGSNTPPRAVHDVCAAAEAETVQWSGLTFPRTDSRDNAPAWSGLRLLEFGSGAAGPVATRYFSEHGATVVRVESTRRPDFLRVMAINSEHGLEGSTLFDVLNPAKKSITLNLKHEDGKAIASRLVHWADAVVENFAPKAMQGWGLDYWQLQRDKPNLVMLSTCLNGQSGPHRDYPGFGGQGAALSGYNTLTGWPDREPVGPFGTITDSLSPRFAATALAAALHYQRRTGNGVYLDVSQVEAGVYSLAPWLLQQAVCGTAAAREGNHNPRAVPHAAFPCAGEDRWIAIACWSDQQWQTLANMAGLDASRYPTLPDRLLAREPIEDAVGAWTSTQSADELAARLQAAAVEAVPVADFRYLLQDDPQLAARDHFLALERARTGTSVYERNGFRLSGARSSIDTPTPLLGEHTEEVLRDCLGLDAAEVQRLRAAGALE